MKKSKFIEEQITYALHQSESGTPVPDVCRQLGCSAASFYLWKQRYGSLGVSEMREVRQLGDENARLERLVGELTLDTHILKEIVKKTLQAVRRRSVVTWVRECLQVSSRACRGRKRPRQ